MPGEEEEVSRLRKSGARIRGTLCHEDLCHSQWASLSTASDETCYPPGLHDTRVGGTEIPGL